MPWTTLTSWEQVSKLEAGEQTAFQYALIIYLGLIFPALDHVNRRTIRLAQSRYKFQDLKCWAANNAGIVKDLEIIVTHAEDKESGMFPFGLCKVADCFLFGI